MSASYISKQIKEWKSCDDGFPDIINLNSKSDINLRLSHKCLEYFKSATKMDALALYVENNASKPVLISDDDIDLSGLVLVAIMKNGKILIFSENDIF